MDKIMRSIYMYLLLLAYCHFKQDPKSCHLYMYPKTFLFTGKSEVKLTYINTKLKWINATEYCFKKNGVLESNDTVIENELNNLNINTDVWIGRYRSFTQWSAIIGCYEVQSGVTLKVDSQGHCQKLCSNSSYFSIKKDQCLCINDIHLLTKVNYKPCNCCNYFPIMKHNFDFDDKDPPDRNDTLNWCVAARCDGKDYKLTRERCGTYYAVQCDNYIRYTGKSQDMATDSCEKNGSFIRWYPESICDDAAFQAQHWTSAKQSFHAFKIIVQGDVNTINPMDCYKGQKQGSQTEYEYVACDLENTFFCRSDTDQGHSSNGSNAGAVAGPIVAVLIIIIAIIAAWFILKRRKNKKPLVRNPKRKPPISDPKLQMTTTRETAVYTEINDNHLPASRKNGYSFASPIPSDNITQNNGNINEHAYTQIYDDQIKQESTKGHDSFDKSNLSETNSNLEANQSQQLNDPSKSEESGKQNQNFEINEIGSEGLQYMTSSAVNSLETANYSLAKPVRESEEIDPYSDNQDYDKLNSVKKKDEDTHADDTKQCKVYDHLPTTPTTEVADPTYDHTVINSPKVLDNNYDHFTYDDEQN